MGALRKTIEAAAKKVDEALNDDQRARGTKGGKKGEWVKDDYYKSGEGSKSKSGYTQRDKAAMEKAGVL